MIGACMSKPWLGFGSRTHNTGWLGVVGPSLNHERTKAKGSLTPLIHALDLEPNPPARKPVGITSVVSYLRS